MLAVRAQEKFGNEGGQGGLLNVLRKVGQSPLPAAMSRGALQFLMSMLPTMCSQVNDPTVPVDSARFRLLW